MLGVVLGGGPLEVGVLDAQHHGALVVPGVEEVVERGAGAAHVQRAGGAGSEAYANVGHGHDSLLSVSRPVARSASAATRATACAAMPSRRPVKPIPSVVVPRRPTASTSTPSAAARRCAHRGPVGRDARLLADHHRIDVHRLPAPVAQAARPPPPAGPCCPPRRRPDRCRGSSGRCPPGRPPRAGRP